MSWSCGCMAFSTCTATNTVPVPGEDEYRRAKRNPEYAVREAKITRAAADVCQPKCAKSAGKSQRPQPSCSAKSAEVVYD